MSRTRMELGAEADARIAQGVKRGETAAEIWKAIGGIVSARTVGERMREIRGTVGAPRHRPSRKPPTAVAVAQELVEELPEDVPTGMPTEQIDEWLSKLDEAIEKVSPGAVDENLPLMAQLIARATALAEVKRKATPLPPPDPDASPDMIALGKQVAERMHKMIDLICAESEVK